MINIALVDDHTLVRKGLASSINSFAGYKVIFEADHGRHFIEQLNPRNLPQIVLLDITMPEMNGYETAGWIKTHYPQIKVLVLTMIKDERAIIKMLRNGAKGYLLKDADLIEFKKAIDSIVIRGLYVNDLLYNNIIQSMHCQYLDDNIERQKAMELSEREKEFLRLLCTDKSYKEIAGAMCLSPRTIDGYRDILFDKLHVVSRIGLVIFAIRNDIVRV